MCMDTTALPVELLANPQPLIGFSGLDVSRNSVHKLIWDTFNNNRKLERPAVQFKLLPPNYEFPVAKPKRPSYEWYHPKGILKRNWMNKHLQVLPAVIVLFQDIEWNDPQWTEKQLQCASSIQSLKNSLQERNTRLCVVLLQKSSPLPPGEDSLASERAASLANACGISNKMLFILPHTDHLMGYTLRLESAFLEMAQTYYAQMAKRIRTHRDQLTSAHTILKIRHQFKLGFVAEMRSDHSTALRHYTQAYGNLEEIRIVDTNCLEIKTVAGFVNYKICRLMFKLNLPRDSINQFITHTEKYKGYTGFRELIFEHFAWMSTQNFAFAELFCEAIKNGLPALQTQHPGLYYYKASEFTSQRREAFLQCCSLNLSPTDPPPSPTPAAFLGDFWGVRAPKPGEPYSDQLIIALVQENEKQFNHSAAIINLLGLAMAQFKIYKCMRFRRKLTIEMAEEFQKSGDNAKALTFFSLMIPDYRQDKWYTIFSDILLKALRCAFLSSSVADFIACSIEALSPKIQGEKNDRILLLENLWKVFHGIPPLSQSQIAPELHAQWETSLASFKTPVSIDLDKISEILECCVSFEKAELKNDELINIRLILKLLTDIPLKIRNIFALLTDGNEVFRLKAVKLITFDNLVDLRESEFNGSEVRFQYTPFELDTKLETDKYYKIIFTTEAQQFLENIHLQVSHIELHMGTEKNFAILTKSATVPLDDFKHYNRYTYLIDNIVLNPTCYIVPTFHLVTQSNLKPQPMLVNEYFNVTTSLSNPFNVFLQNVGLSISVPSNLRNKVFLTTDTSTVRHKLHSQIQIDIGELTSQGSTSVSYYVFSLFEAVIELNQKIWYHLESNRIPSNKIENSSVMNDMSPTTNRPILVSALPLPISSSIRIDFIDEKRLKKTREDTVCISCIPEFKFCGRFYTLNRQPLSKVYRGENFLLRANIEVQSPIDLDILETYFICDHNLVQSTYSFKRKRNSSVYKKSETLEDVIVLRTNSSLQDWVTQKEFEASKTEPLSSFSRHRHVTSKSATNPSAGLVKAENPLNKSILSKIPNNMTIIGNVALMASQNSNLSLSSISDDGKLRGENDSQKEEAAMAQVRSSPRVVFNKAMDALQPTGPFRGFVKGVMATEGHSFTMPIFGVYCIKWRRHGEKDENESKFVISGLDIEEPPLNIYCSVEEKMFVKVPMTLKVVLKNPTSKVIYLISTLSVSNSDNFMCSGHKQLNISIFAFSEKELVFNLYPLKVGWQNLPELALEYNTQADPSKTEGENAVLCQLVQRSMPKKVFVLPPCKSPQQHLTN